jgi:hypothetical protein
MVTFSGFAVYRSWSRSPTASSMKAAGGADRYAPQSLLQQSLLQRPGRGRTRIAMEIEGTRNFVVLRVAAVPEGAQPGDP